MPVFVVLGFQLDAGKFFFFVFALVLTAVCASSLAFLVSASVRIFAVANVLVTLPYVLMMLFGGFLVNTGSLLVWLEWIKYVSIFRYGINVSHLLPVRYSVHRRVLAIPHRSDGQLLDKLTEFKSWSGRWRDMSLY